MPNSSNKARPKEKPRPNLSFAAKVGLAGLCLPLIAFLGSALYPPLAAFFYLWLIPILLPISYLFPQMVFTSAFLFGFTPIFYGLSVVATFPLWYGLGHLAGRLTTTLDLRGGKAGALLLIFSGLVLMIGYGLQPLLEKNMEAISAEQTRAYNVKTQQARLKLWCTQELGRFTFAHGSGFESWEFRGHAESVKRCDDIYVLAEPRSLTDAADFYLLYPHQTFLGACHPTQSPERCLTFKSCGEDLCAQFR